MALSVVAGSAVGAASSTSISKPTSSGYVETANDLIVVMCQSSSISGTSIPTLPTGFTALAHVNTASGGDSAIWGYKLDNGTESWPKSWTPSTGSSFNVWNCIILRGNDTTTPTDGTATTDFTVTGTTLSLPAITATVAGDTLVIMIADDGDVNVSTWPTGVTEYADSSNPTGNGVVAGTKASMASGSTGTLGVTMNASPGTTVGCAFLVKPASGGSVVAGSANEQSNSALVESSAVILAPATEQANAALVETAALIIASGDTLQSNSALVETSATIIASGDVLQSNAAFSVVGQVVTPSATMQANAVITAPAQVMDPAVTLQSNSVLAATGGQLGANNLVSNAALSVTGQVVANGQTLTANAVITEAAQIVAAALAALDANAVLSATGAILGQTVIGSCAVSVAAPTVTLSAAALGTVMLSAAELGTVTLTAAVLGTCTLTAAALGSVTLAAIVSQ